MRGNFLCLFSSVASSRQAQSAGAHPAVAGFLFSIPSAGKVAGLASGTPRCPWNGSQTPPPTANDERSHPAQLCGSIRFISSFLEAAPPSALFKAPRTKSPFPAFKPVPRALFPPLLPGQVWPGKKQKELVEGLRAPDSHRPAGPGGSPSKSGPSPKVTQLFPLPAAPGAGAGGSGARRGRGAAPSPRGRAPAPQSSLARAGCGR